MENTMSLSTECIECGKKFKNQQNLDKHIDNNECENYKKVNMLCKKCGVRIKDFRSINSHFSSCNETTNVDINHMLSLKLSYERLKNMILSDYIENVMKMPVSDIIDETSTDNITIYSKTQSIPLKIHKFLDDEVIHLNMALKIDPRPKKKEDIVIENIVVEDDSSSDDKDVLSEQLLIDKVDMPIDVSSINLEILALFDSMKKNGVLISPLATNICKLMQILSTTYTLNMYEEAIKANISSFKTIMQSKSFTKKNIQEFIELLVTPLEMRLIFYDGYTKTTITPDDISHFRTVWVNTLQYPKKYIAYTPNEYKNFYNYSLCICSLYECIEKVIINGYGFNNYIYLPYVKSCDTDPHTFYYLKKIDDNGIKYWTMDNRCGIIAKDLSEALIPYIIALYRRIYYDTYCDNIYKKPLNIPPIIENECEQLLRTLFILCNQQKLRKIIQRVIIKGATYAKTKQDKFNIRADDIIKADELKSDVFNVSFIIDILKQLYDDISDNVIGDVIKKYQ